MSNYQSKKTSYFESNLKRAKTWIASRPNESNYVLRYLPKIIEHLKSIKEQHSHITEQEMQELLFQEIDGYASTVYENSYVFGKYIEYLSNQFFSTHPDKYKEFVEKVKNSNTNFEKASFQDCSNFQECLELYVYNLEKDLLQIIFEGYLEDTPENYKNFDELLQKYKKQVSKQFFDAHFTLPEVSEVLGSDELDKPKKAAKIKEYSSWFRNPSTKKSFQLFSNIFMNGSSAFLSSDKDTLEESLRKDLAHSTEQLVDKLDSLGHLDDYMISYVQQMCRLGFPEFATPFCTGGKPDQQFAFSLESLPQSEKVKKIKQIINKNKLKSSLSTNYLCSLKSINLENLLALNTFWTNRYIKELDFYSETMFAVHNFGLISKVLNDEDIQISPQEIDQMLIKMNTFYKSASIFIEKKQRELNESETEHSEQDTEDLESKIIRYSYDPYINDINRKFGNEYKKYFSQIFPDSQNDVSSDADWYIRLYNPINSSYSMKNESINSLIASIENSTSSNFVNAGVIPDKISPDGTIAELPYSSIGIGIDAGLTSPVRIHIRRDVLTDFLKSINGHTIVPIYEGASDFNQLGTNTPISTHLVTPITDKHKEVIKKVSKKISTYKNPKLVAHLCFSDTKHTPEHLQSIQIDSRGKTKKTFITRYVNLESGIIYTKSNDTYEKVTPNTSIKGGNSDHEL